MDWIVTLVVGMLAFFGGTGLDRLSVAGRLRARLQAETELYSALPEGSQVQPDLLLHIERQALLLVAEEEPLTTWEIMDRRWGRLYVYLVFPLLASLFLFATALWIQLLYSTLAIVAFSYGFVRTARVERALNMRKLAKRSLADVDNTKYVAPTGLQMLTSALKSFWPPHQNLGWSTRGRTKGSIPATPPEDHPRAHSSREGTPSAGSTGGSETVRFDPSHSTDKP